MATICNSKPCGFWVRLLFLATVLGHIVTARGDNPLQHRINEYVTREGYWSSVHEHSSLTLGGNETYPDSTLLTYVVRAKWEKEIIPGKFTYYSNGRVYFTYQRKQISCTSCDHEFLYHEPYFTWVRRENGDICNGAVVGGISTSFEKYYICQFNYYDPPNKIDEVLLGVLIPSLGECHAGWNSADFSSTVYNVLRDSRYA